MSSLIVCCESEFKCHMKKIFRLKNVVILCLISLFMWWGSNAVVRFWCQPLTTDISHSFGDNTIGIQFPLITICDNTNFYQKNPTLEACGDGSWNYISEFQSCMKTDKNFNVSSFMKSLQNDIKNIVEVTYFWTGEEYLDLNYIDDQVWFEVFTDLDGPCYTFDLSRIDQFKYVPYSERSRPGIEFVVAKKNTWKMATMYLHTRNDMPDANQLNEIAYLKLYNKRRKGHVISIRKKKKIRENQQEMYLVYNMNTKAVKA